MTGQLILQIFLTALYAFFTAAESSVISMNDSRLEKLSASGDKRAVRLKRLTARPARFLSSMQTAGKLVCFIGLAAAAYNFTGRLVNFACDNGLDILPKSVLSVLALIVIVLAAAFVMIVFGEAIPKCAVARAPEKFALGMSRVIVLTAGFFTPFVWLTGITSRGIMKLLHIDPDAGENTVTEEEILMMSDAGAEKGTIDEDENRIIKNVFAFDDMTAEQVCTHRTDVSVLWTSDSIEVWEETIHRTRHSAFPVCGESVDNVIGILDAKDYFRLEDKSRENIMKNAVTEPYFVHENMKADRLFEQMKQRGADHFAVVVDEYGGMSGIITVTDLVEKLVGDFADDDDELAVKLEQIGENVWNVPGIQSLSDVSEELDTALPADKFDTFGGYVIDVLGEIPKEGSTVRLETDALLIEVLDVRHHRIELCRVTKKTADSDTENNGEEL